MEMRKLVQGGDIYVSAPLLRSDFDGIRVAKTFSPPARKSGKVTSNVSPLPLDQEDQPIPLVRSRPKNRRVFYDKNAADKRDLPRWCYL